MKVRAIGGNRGFSLIELMVVVAIIAILSMVAVPSYKSFQARARQKEGFNLLNTYFTAAQATRTEFGLFPGDLVQTGFAPVGQLGYRLRVADGNPIPIAANDDVCFRTQENCNCGGACPLFKTWTEQPVAAFGSIGVASVGTGGCGGAIPGGPAVTDNTFVAIVAGWISSTAALNDRYAINENKVIQMCQDGLK